MEQVTGDFQRGFSLTLQHAGLSSTAFRRALSFVPLAEGGSRAVSSRRHMTARGARFVGLKAHVQGVPLDRHVELHTIRHGYCGMVEVADGVTNLCCWVEAKVLRRAGGAPHRFLASGLWKMRICVYDCSASNRLAYRGRPPVLRMGETVAPVVSEIWNIGDCAAMVAPLTGDGMAMGCARPNWRRQ